jgi:hypothetical protein
LNPFTGISLKDGNAVITPAVHNPDPNNAYADIKQNLSSWIEDAIAQ